MALTLSDGREVAVSALSRRDLSERAVARRLLAAGATDQVVQETLDWLIECGYVDDVSLARLRALKLAEKGYGDAAIAARLVREEIEREALDGALAELEPEGDRVRRVVERTPLRGRRRAAMFLARRGFCDESIEAGLVALDAQADARLR